MSEIEKLLPVGRPQLVRRAAFICKYCDGVYADEPVTSCDCLGHYDQNPPHFIKGEIKYRLPNTPALPRTVGSGESSTNQ